MKMFFIILILITSVLTSILLAINSPIENRSTQEFLPDQSLDKLIHKDLEQVRRITKDGDISAFDISSIKNLQKKIIDQPLISESFLKDYSNLNDIIQDTVSSIRDSEPRLSKQISKAKENTLKFQKKLKSIGLSELNISWRSNQKIYRNFLRRPEDKLYKNFQSNIREMKLIISELYLEDDDEAYLFSILDHYKLTIRAQYHVYQDVGFKRIKQIKPLVYSLKEQIQLNPLFFSI